ncbi:MAG: hypothetical protein J6Y06_01725 [Bacteroidales bacterium]|nr:hypothetical protein [Bacteroidales bacterium]
MVSIYDFNPTQTELMQIFSPLLTNQSKEEYLQGMTQESLYIDVAYLLWIRGQKRKAKYYLSKLDPQQRMDFLNSVNGF